MSDAKWQNIESAPEGVVVETKAPSGNVQPLKRRGNLWFLPDGSMYVYYTPVAWRAGQSAN